MSDSEMQVDDDHRQDTNVKRKGRGFNPRAREEDDALQGVKGTATFDRLNEKETVEERAARSVEGWILIITGVHEEASEDDLQDKFADFGQIRNVHLNLDRRTGYVKGYALIEYETYSDARSAIQACSSGEVQLMEQDLKADFAFVRPPTTGTKEGNKANGGNKGAQRRNRSRSPGRRG